MKKNIRRSYSTWLLSACVGIIASVLCGSNASAQRFQYTYGGPATLEAGRGGVLQASTGGYLTVGESVNPVAGGGSDIYVVRTDNWGALVWSYTYSIGVNDSALDVEEVFNSCPGVNPGGFIITGVTDNRGQPACPASRDAFLLRIDDCGNVLWVRTYGSPNSDEIGWNVDEAISGTPSRGTNPGDFIVSGSTTFNTAPGTRDGYIFRTDCRGNLIWDRTYASPATAGDDYFYGVTETRQPVPAGQPGSNPPLGSNTFDIVACGGSNGFCNPGSYDAWIVRVDGNNGFIGAAPENSASYGRTRTEDLRSVIELQNPGFASDLVFTGRTNDNTPNFEAYVLETQYNPCVFRADKTMGDFGPGLDEGYWVTEIPFQTCFGAPQGSLAITGYFTPPTGLGFGLKDAFAHLCAQGNLAGFTTAVYGGSADDWGWSITPVANSPFTPPCFTEGYVISGFTQSPALLNPATNPQDLYLIKTSCGGGIVGPGLDSRCNWKSYPPRVANPNLPSCCTLPIFGTINQWCTPNITRTRQFWQWQLCLVTDGTNLCLPPQCPDVQPKAPAGGDDELSDNAITFEETGTVSSYPNPVTRGTELTVDYLLNHDALASLRIVDMTGKVVYEHTGSYAAGRTPLQVSTDGWAAGSYVLNVTIGKQSQSRRIVVVDSK